ncbi:MAG: hypothetical protein J5I41_07100 [Saprospiraceae bacterium]|nr:hypothetical protein [Saprospiraceae bacterium]
MKILIELARIANLKRVSKIDIFDAHSVRSKSSKFNAFYEAMANGRFRTDREAAKALYNTTPSDDRYRQLKSRFRRRLLNTLFFLNANSPLKPRYEQALVEVQRDWALVNILKLYDSEQTAPYLARQILTQAQRHHFTSIMVDCLRFLLEVAYQEGDVREHDRLKELLLTLEPVEKAESEATLILQEIGFRRSDPVNPPTAEEWNQWREGLILLSEKHPSPLTRYLSYLAGAMQYLEEEQDDLTILICQEADQMMLNQPEHFSTEHSFRIRYLLMQAYYRTERFTGAMDNAESVARELEPGSLFWYQFFDIYYLIALRSENYTTAMAILQRVLTHDTLVRQDAETRKRWQLYQVALYYVVKTRPDLQRFRQSRLFAGFREEVFLEDAALFPRSERVLTVWTLILQMLVHWERGEEEKVAVIIDRLKHYARKQLQPARQERFIEFIRCLSTITKANFDPDKIRLDNKYYMRLLNLPHRYHGQLDQWEIFPFPTLWAWIHKRIGVPS